MRQIINEKFWINIAKKWKKIPCPMHPWPSEMKIYKIFSQKALKQVKCPKILILGATPEMRDLAHSFKNAEITCVDIDINMILAMRELMRHKKETEREIWIKGDWMTVPLKKNYYHLILGEAVLANIKFPLWPNFLKHLNKLVKSKGAFITRVVITVNPSSEWFNKSLDDVFRYTKANKLNAEELRFLLYVRIWHPKIKAMGDQDIFQTVKNFWQKGKQNFFHPDSYIQKLLNQIKENYNWPPKSGYRWSNRTKEVCERYLKKYFKVAKMKYGGGETPCPISYHPIYLLKKKIR